MPSDAAMRQRRTPSSWSHQKLEESKKDSPTHFWRERSPNDTWISDI